MIFSLIALQYCLDVFTHSTPEVKTSRKSVKIARRWIPTNTAFWKGILRNSSCCVRYAK